MSNVHVPMEHGHDTVVDMDVDMDHDMDVEMDTDTWTHGHMDTLWTQGVMLRKIVALIADIGNSGVEGVSQRRRRFFGSGVLAFHDFN